MLASGAWLYVTVSLVLLATAAFAAGLFLGRLQRGVALAEAGASIDALAAASPAWPWRSDATHRLQASRWSAAAPASGALWQHFESLDGGVQALRQVLEQQAAFGPLRVRRLPPGAATQAAVWLLRGGPLRDDKGRFAGFAGSAQPAADAALTDRMLLDALFATSREPLLVALGSGSGDGSWRVQLANAAARDQLGGSSTLPSWETVVSRLPMATGTAIAELALDTPVEREGWLLRRLAIGDGQALLLAGAAAAAGEGAATAATSFSYTVTHDLRAPIRVVEGFTRILKEDYGRLLDRVGNEHIERVLGAAARMNQMIDAMLTLARLSSLPLASQPVDLSQLAGYIVDDLRRGAPERLADVEIEAGIVVRGDPTLLRVVLENLLGNAWKYTQRAPRARIALAREAQPGRQGFTVRDNGAGFDMRSAERLFGLFQRLHSASEFAGTGVGLASVKRIVQRHGGEIWAEAEPGRGATFHVTLRD